MDSGPARGSQGQSVRVGPVGRTKLRFQTSPGQTARDALRGRGIHHYQGNPPQLRYTPIADAASRCRGNPSLLRYTPTADAACRCQGNPLQQTDSAAGHSPWWRPQKKNRVCSNRENHTKAGRSLGRQTVSRLPPNWAGHLNRHPKIKPEPPKTEHFRKKGFFLMSSVAAESNIAA